MPDKFIVPERVTREAYIDLLEQFEILQSAAQEVETLAFRQYLDWMHFHEVAMAKPFEAETEAQDFARRVSSLLTIALGPDSTIEVVDSNPACEHEWVDATNEAVESGEFCVKCHAFRAAQSPAKRSKDPTVETGYDGFIA